MGSDLPDPNASVTLPPEIMGKILEHIPTNSEGRWTLVACALVASWWTGPSQRRLFSSVEINEPNHERWMNGVALSGSKDRLEYVRSLWDCCGPDIEIKEEIRVPAQNPGEYFLGLRNIHSLTLFNTEVKWTSEEELHTRFSAFRETLTSLSLESFTASFSAVVALVDHFPNISALQLRSFVLKPDEGPVPSLSRPFRGKLHVRDIHADYLEFLDRFAALNLEYDQLVIDSSSLFTGPEFLKSALQISASTVKSLKLTAELEPGVEATICDFQQLQELELVVAFASPTIKTFLSSITSIELRKIVFLVRYMHGRESFVQQTKERGLIDEELCRLVDRLEAMGYCHTLEVELRLMKFESNPGRYDITMFLPNFWGKGIVSIVDPVHGDRVLHSSR